MIAVEMREQHKVKVLRCDAERGKLFVDGLTSSDKALICEVQRQ